MLRRNNTFYLLMAVVMILIATTGCATQGKGQNPTETVQSAGSVKPVVSATGEVKPAQWSTLSMSVPGSIAEVLVGEGDAVKEGQVLLRLKGKEDLQSAEVSAEYDVLNAQQALHDLQKNADVAKADAERKVAAANRAVREATYQLENYLVPSDQIDLTGTQAVAVMKERLDAAYAAFKPYQGESSDDKTRKDLKETLDNAQSAYDSAVRRLELETTLDQAQAGLEKAHQDADKVKDGVDPEQLALAEARLKNANAALDAAKAAVEDTEIRAPFAGVVGHVDARAGEWVNAGQPLFIIADLAHLRVETTDLNEIDVARVQVGQAVHVTFDALPDVGVQGKVTKISPKSSAGSGVNYTVIVEIDRTPQNLRWGMTAFVDIQVEQ